MSLELLVMLPTARLPTRAEWQAQIDQLGFDVQLDPELDVARDEGFSPTTIAGRSSGFELSIVDAAAVAEAYPVRRRQFAPAGRGIRFRWGGDFAECGCVLAAAAALVHASDAVAYHPADDLLYDLAGLTSEFEACVAELS